VVCTAHDKAAAVAIIPEACPTVRLTDGMSQWGVGAFRRRVSQQGACLLSLIKPMASALRRLYVGPSNPNLAASHPAALHASGEATGPRGLRRCTSAVSFPFASMSSSMSRGGPYVGHGAYNYTPSSPLGKIASRPCQPMTRPTAGTRNRQTMQGPHGSAGRLGGRISRYTRPDPNPARLIDLCCGHRQERQLCPRNVSPAPACPDVSPTALCNVSFFFSFARGRPTRLFSSRVDPSPAVDLCLPAQASRSAPFPRDAGKWPHSEASACVMDVSADIERW
jgi:hypothetical protein